MLKSICTSQFQMTILSHGLSISSAKDLDLEYILSQLIALTLLP